MFRDKGKYYSDITDEVLIGKLLQRYLFWTATYDYPVWYLKTGPSRTLKIIEVRYFR
jgi:hypothetical protein